MKWRVLVTAPPILPKIERYRELFFKNNAEFITPNFHVMESLKQAELQKLLVDVDAILCGDDEINAAVIHSANKLKIISKWGTGIDSIDVDAAKKAGITVCRVADAFADPLADTVMAYILSYCRKINEKNQLVREGRWQKTESFTLREKVLGVVGVGHIGQAVIQRAHAFGMRILAHDRRTIRQEIIDRFSLPSCSFHELLAHSDFISINCDLNESSYHLFSTEQFNLMKESAVLINTARGAVIDEQSLIIALKNKVIAGAALDVFEFEPLPKDSELRSLNNVFLSPHNSNASPVVFDKVDLASIHHIFNFFNSMSIEKAACVTNA